MLHVIAIYGTRFVYLFTWNLILNILISSTVIALLDLDWN